MGNLSLEVDTIVLIALYDAITLISIIWSHLGKEISEFKCTYVCCGLTLTANFFPVICWCFIQASSLRIISIRTLDFYISVFEIYYFNYYF